MPGKRKEEVLYSQKRFVWADIVRVVAIFLVVYVHQLYLLPELTFQTLLLWTPELFAQIGVPLFVLVSGALLLPKNESLMLFFTKRIRSVLFPWVFWVGIYSFLALSVSDQRFAAFTDFITFEYKLFFSRFWFLPMIFGLYLLTPVLRVFIRHATNTNLFYFLSLWFIFIVLLPVTPAIFNKPVVPDTSLLFFILQYIGLYILGFILVYKRQFFSVRGWVVILFLSVLLTYAATFLDSLTGYPAIDRTFSRIFSPTFLPGVVAIFMILFMSYKRLKPSYSKAQTVLREVSQCALGIYLVHELVQEGLNMFPLLNEVFRQVYPVFAIPFRAVIVFVISFVIIFLLRRIPLIKDVAS